MIRVTDLVKQANGTRILNGVSFEVRPQSVLGIIGASGSGKTTLLRCLNGLERIDGGAIDFINVRLEGKLSHAEYARRVKELRRKVGTVFQHLNLFPHLSVLGNIIEAPTQVLHVPRRKAVDEAYDLLDSVGLKDKARRYPESLSGGEQQRVAIARALINHPKLILADEPTGNLDEANEAVVLNLLRELHAAGHTILFVTHSQAIGNLADRRIELEHGRLARIVAASQAR